MLNKLYPIGCKYNENFPIYTLSGIILLFRRVFYTLSGIELKLATITVLQYSLNIAFTIEDFSTQLAVRQYAVVAIVLQGATTDFHQPSLPHLWQCGQVESVRPDTYRFLQDSGVTLRSLEDSAKFCEVPRSLMKFNKVGELK